MICNKINLVDIKVLWKRKCQFYILLGPKIPITITQIGHSFLIFNKPDYPKYTNYNTIILTVCSHESGLQHRQKLSPLTEGSVPFCRSTNLRLNYLIDQAGAPQGAALPS